jgi:hypothetical protein
MHIHKMMYLIRSGKTLGGDRRSTVASTVCGSLTARHSSSIVSSTPCSACSKRVTSESVVGAACAVSSVTSVDATSAVESACTKQ